MRWVWTKIVFGNVLCEEDWQDSTDGKDSANSDAILVWRNRNTGNLESKIEDKNR